MSLSEGDRVELLRDVTSAHRGECGVVTVVLPQSREVIVRITHDTECNLIVASFELGPLPQDWLTVCHCP